MQFYVAGPVVSRDFSVDAAARLYTDLEAVASDAGVTVILPWRDPNLSALGPQEFAERIYQAIEDSDALLLVVLKSPDSRAAYSLGCEAQRARERGKRVAILTDDVEAVPRLLFAIAEDQHAYDVATTNLRELIDGFSSSPGQATFFSSY